MSDSRPPAPAAVAPPSNVSVPGLLLLLLALIILLYSGDRFLAQLEQRELRQASRREFEAGEALRKQGKLPDAIVHLRQAHTLVRADKDYAVSLVDAYIAAHQSEAARRILDELLAADPNDARANLLMARLLASEQKFGSADSYYHRAIYGTWPSDADGSRLNARLELAEMLAGHGSQQELLSETLALLEAVPESVTFTRKIAPLLLRAGSGSRAAAAYRFLLRQDRGDIDSYIGLGQAELEEGDYHAAQLAFASASERRPGDLGLGRQVGLAERLANLDPTPRRLGSREKFARSSEILRLVEQDIAYCLHGKDATGDLRSRLELADRLIAERIGAAVTNEQAEARLDAAASLWAVRSSICSRAPSDGDPLPIIMSKLAK